MKKNKIHIFLFLSIFILGALFIKYLYAKASDNTEIIVGDTTSLIGDVNGDNVVNTLDYILVKKHIINLSILTGDMKAKADVNNDGKTNTSDYILIKKIILGLNPGGNTSNTSYTMLTCPNSPVDKTYNGKNQSSGINCPNGSTASETTSAVNAGIHIQKCIPNAGYAFKSECAVSWNINHSSTAGTITFHKNIPGDDETIVKVYNKSISVDTFVIPDNWQRPGYVFAGWAGTKNATVPQYKVGNDMNTSILKGVAFSELYAVWVKVNSKYGNVVFIGDSYVGTSNWPALTASKLGIGYSYTIVDKPGSGFCNQISSIGDIGGGSVVDFSSLLAYADKIIGDNSQVKYVVAVGGYNDHPYSKDQIKNAILYFAKVMHERFPNATLYLGMAGANFTDINIEKILLTTTSDAFSEAASLSSYIKYISNVNGDGTTSISGYIRWFGNYDGTTSLGCKPSNITNNCYYLIENSGGTTYTIHPTSKTGFLIADIVASSLK